MVRLSRTISLGTRCTSPRCPQQGSFPAAPEGGVLDARGVVLLSAQQPEAADVEGVRGRVRRWALAPQVPPGVDAFAMLFRSAATSSDLRAKGGFVRGAVTAVQCIRPDDSEKLDILSAFLE